MKVLMLFKSAVLLVLFFSFDVSAGPIPNALLVSLSTCPNSSSYFNCGFGLLHAGGLCVHPSGGADSPATGTPLILFSDCNTSSQARLRFRILENGSLYHVSSGMCVHPEGGSKNPVNGTKLIFWPSCTDGPLSNIAGNPRLAFEFTPGGSIRHKNSGLCIHPSGGSANPASGTQLVLWGGCDEYRLKFTMLPY